MTLHGASHRALDSEHISHSIFAKHGVFGRMFPALPSFEFTDEMLEALNGKMERDSLAEPEQGGPDNPRILAGFTFLGQFIDHDITFDPTSSLERQNDPEAIHNFRTPSLELDNVYGSGPGASPHLYDMPDDPRKKPVKLLIGRDSNGEENDLPRNRQGTALIGDPRNDENLIISQLHLAFLKFHNRVVDHLRQHGDESGTELDSSEALFRGAQRFVRWHYQWIIVHEFLPLIVGEKLMTELRNEVELPLIGPDPIGNILDNLKYFRWRGGEPFIPIEFAMAAYRFGHSQVRPGYRINSAFRASLFPEAPDAPSLFVGRNLVDDGAGHKVLTAGRQVDWARFNRIPGLPESQGQPQPGKKIDGRLSPSLFTLPMIPPNQPDNPQSLPMRNLMRGRAFSLPWGQRVAATMSAKHILSDEELEVDGLCFPKGRAPLWYYILKEAQVQNNGEFLGEVGGRLVAEVLVGLLVGDQKSYLSMDPTWRPCLPAEKQGDFKLGDLFKFAGVGTFTPA